MGWDGIPSSRGVCDDLISRRGFGFGLRSSFTRGLELGRSTRLEIGNVRVVSIALKLSGNLELTQDSSQYVVHKRLTWKPTIINVGSHFLGGGTPGRLRISLMDSKLTLFFFFFFFFSLGGPPRSECLDCSSLG